MISSNNVLASLLILRDNWLLFSDVTDNEVWKFCATSLDKVIEGVRISNDDRT